MNSLIKGLTGLAMVVLGVWVIIVEVTTPARFDLGITFVSILAIVFGILTLWEVILPHKVR